MIWGEGRECLYDAQPDRVEITYRGAITFHVEMQSKKIKKTHALDGGSETFEARRQCAIMIM